MGRPNLSNQRRSEILSAAASCIERYGLEGMTLARVAEAAGVQRPIIRHYIGNRDALLAALVEFLTDQYRNDYEALASQLPSRRRIDAMMEYLFAGESLERPEEDAVIDALLAAAAKDQHARTCLRKMYELFETICFNELRAAFPKAKTRRIRSVAYAIVCLAEQNASLIRLGFPGGRSSGARAAARTLIQSLTT